MDPQQQQQQQYSIPMDHLFHPSSMSPIFSTTQPYPPQPTTPIHTAPPTIPQHPPYEEMITMAIVALNESEGSSKQAISKYLDRVFKNLPSNHSELLAYHMKRLKNSGQIVLYKRSYLLPSRSAPPPPPPPCNVAATSNGGAAAGSTLTSLSPSGISSAQNIGNAHYNYQSYYDVPVGLNQNEEQASVAARRVDHALPVVSKNVAPPAEGNVGISGSEAMFVSLGLSDGPSVEVTPQTKKRRGRPPKSASSGAGLGQGTLESGVGKETVQSSAVGKETVQSSAVGKETVQSSSVGQGMSESTCVRQEILGSSTVGQGIQGLVEQSGSKRKRGRPRKSESSVGPPAPGVFPVQVPVGAPSPTPAPSPAPAPVPAASGTGRARGKPKRYADEAVTPNRKLGRQQPKKRGRKPKNLGLMAIYSADPVTMVMPNPGNNVGDVVNPQQYTVVSSNGVASLHPIASNGVTQVPSGKRRGRPPGVGRLNKHMKFTGKPMGRPRKNPSAQSGTPNVDNSQNLTVQNLKSNLVYLQSKIRENVSIIKHFVNMETSVDAMGALEHLEELATAEF